MQLSAIGRACLIAREGRRLKAYRDGVGVWTIGIGCTSASGLIAVAPGLTITAAECDALFDRAWPRYAQAVASVAGEGLAASLADHQADALISFCYNIGPAAFAGSTAARRLAAGNLDAVPGAMLRWRRPAAIVARRRAEAAQFATPYAVALPRPTATQPPVAPGAAPAGPAAALPAALDPVHAPPAHPWLGALGAWVDRVFAPAGPHREVADRAARG